MIRRSIRLIGIGIILARYRLDDLLHDVPPLRWLRTVRLLPWGRRRVRDLPRGARLRMALEELGPIYVKFGQILSTRRDLLPIDIADELAQLQDAVPPFPGQQARALIESQLGDRIENLFAEFDITPMASASIAQVHAARLKDGREVVIKVVRPGIEKNIQRDLELLTALAKLVRRYHPEGERIRPNEIVGEFERVIAKETDMENEAANASLLRRNFENSEDLYIPLIHWHLTAPKVLVMERVYGVSIKDINQLKQMNVDLERLARRGVRVFYTQVFRDNLFHADMHPGNILVDASDPANPTLIALDFGIVASLTPRDLYYIGENFLAIFNREYRRVAELHVEAGWVPADTRIDELESAARTVCEPSFTRPLEEVSFGELVIKLFAVARQFKLTLQPQLIMLQKTLLNIEGMGRDLYPKLNIWEVAKPELERIFRERYGLQKTAEAVGRELPGWLAKVPDLPDMVYNYLKRANAGQLATRIDSQTLDALLEQTRRRDRRLPATLLASSLIISAVLLAIHEVAPLFMDHSVPAFIALAAAGLALWRGWSG